MSEDIFFVKEQRCYIIRLHLVISACESKVVEIPDYNYKVGPSNAAFLSYGFATSKLQQLLSCKA